MTPAEWLLLRLDDPPAVRVQRNDHGWDVMLRIDGGYGLEDALRVVEGHRRELAGLTAQARLDLGWCPDAA